MRKYLGLIPNSDGSVLPKSLFVSLLLCLSLTFCFILFLCLGLSPSLSLCFSSLHACLFVCFVFLSLSVSLSLSPSDLFSLSFPQVTHTSEVLWEGAGRGLGPCTIPEKRRECQPLPPRDSLGPLPLLPACWVLGEAHRFQGLAGLRKGESPAETERERDGERLRRREGAADEEERQ